MTRAEKTVLGGFYIALFFLGLVSLAGCTGCNHIAPDKDQVCGPYSSFFWLPS